MDQLVPLCYTPMLLLEGLSNLPHWIWDHCQNKQCWLCKSTRACP